MKISGIYAIVNLYNGKRYVGSSLSIAKRKHLHIWYLNKRNHQNKHLQRAWNKYGIDGFEFIVLEECDKDDLIGREQYYIDILKPEYNICLIAGNTQGRKFSDEAIEKNRLAHLGKITSPETKIKLSIAGKGKKRSTETRAKMSIAQMGNKKSLGRIVSKEARLKSSISNKRTKSGKWLNMQYKMMLDE